jgi:hypothetical protein
MFVVPKFQNRLLISKVNLVDKQADTISPLCVRFILFVQTRSSMWRGGFECKQLGATDRGWPSVLGIGRRVDL